jgi:hypothetical protein
MSNSYMLAKPDPMKDMLNGQIVQMTHFYIASN